MDLDAGAVVGIIHIAFSAAAHDQVRGVSGGFGQAGYFMHGNHAAGIKNFRRFHQRGEVQPGAFTGIAVFCKFRHFFTSILSDW